MFCTVVGNARPLLLFVVVIVAGRLAGTVVEKFVVLVVETTVEVVSLLAAFVDRSEFRVLSSIGSRVERARVFVHFHSLRNVVILKVSVQC